MPSPDLPPRDLDEDAALRSILEGTAAETGEGFFAALVKHLSEALSVHSAWVTEWFPERRRLRALAFWKADHLVSDYEYDVGGTPCEPVMEEDRLIQFPEDVMDLFPEDPDLAPMGAVSYIGVPLKDVDGRIMGHLAVQDTRPLSEDDERVRTIFRIFAARAAAELRRLRAECEVREREEKLGLLVDSAMDGIVELDHECRVMRMNTAALKVFSCVPEQTAGHDLGRFLLSESRDRLGELCEALATRSGSERYMWIPGGLTAVRAGGEEFPAEATLSRYELRGDTFFTLILRNVNERLEAERKIQSLTVETEYLREEIKQLQGFDEIIGRSDALKRVLRDVHKVAGTETTVLVQGETGTGKELVARAIHAASGRSAKPFVTVNCAAIPATLIESEFFGHEKGAFTGATQKRDGRFALAHGGTIFLDEIGELSLELQSKLLRVLQEGEFEPVGSSKTRAVDVRVVAATNRDLQQAVAGNEFREDLFYRLNVFPITVPPLRERQDDIPLLAESFARRFAQRMGRDIEPLSAAATRRLQSYRWPGNVRELENVMERAVITAEGGRLDVEHAIPAIGPGAAAGGPRAAAAPPGTAPEAAVPIHTVQEMQQLEKANLVRALEAAGWKITGQSGAAELLGMKPSTLTSRMKALGIERPR
jgi:PAS domain S-box-containing protein